MPTLLEIIAESRRNELRNRNIQEFDNIENSEYRDLNNNYFNDEAVISRTPIPTLQNNEGLESIGERRLEDVKFRNLLRPENDTYRVFEIINDLSVVDSGDLLQIAENKRNNDLFSNEYGIFGEPINITNESIPYSERYDNYLNYFNSLNTNRLSVIDNVIDLFRGTLTFEDTDLGNIALEEYRKNILENFQKRTENLVLGRLNTNIGSLLQGDNFINKDFNITKRNGALGTTLDLIERLQGVYLPFDKDNDNMFGIKRDNIKNLNDRIALTLKYTGKAYQKLISQNHLKNTYYPELTIYNNFIVDNSYVTVNQNGQLNLIDFNGKYIRTQGIIDNTVDKPLTTTQYGINFNVKRYDKAVDKKLISESWGINIEDENIIENDWNNLSSNFFNEKSLLYKTKEIILNNSNGQYLDSFAKEFLINQNGDEFTISRGSSITSENGFTADDGTEYKENEFYRVFTKNHKFNRLSRNLKHRGLDNNEPSSSLGENGLPIFAPTLRSNNNEEIILKRYMFSIANSAWKNHSALLPDCEKYISPNGDIYRQMWFAPYDLKIVENTTQSIDTTNFLGRGEPIYTSNYSERTATISFALLVDYPSIVNLIKGEKTHIWERYLTGDKSVQAEINERINNRLNPIEQEQINQLIAQAPKKQYVVNNNNLNKVNDNVDKRYIISAFFPNEVTNTPLTKENTSVINNGGYEDGETLLGQSYLNGRQKERIQYRDQTNFGLNIPFFFNYKEILENEINSILSINPNKITFLITGYASAAKTIRITNNDLSLQRANNINAWLQDKLNETNIINIIPDNVEIEYIIDFKSDTQDNNTIDDTAGDLYDAKFARRVDVEVIVNNDINENETIDDRIADINNNNVFTTEYETNLPVIDDAIFQKLFIDGCEIFKFLEINDPIAFSTISQKIDYFEPAYHSYTPQNFNQRLTFLQQCMRSATNNYFGENNENLWFGNQPFIYISIGDWFRTKAIIENLTIDYNAYTDGTPNYDLNPESITGIQPLFANISIDIKIIGGQSMEGAIKKVQNALSFNYYANTHNYDIRADRTIFKDNGEGIVIDGFKGLDNENVNNINNNDILVQQGYTSENDNIIQANNSSLNKTEILRIVNNI